MKPPYLELSYLQVGLAALLILINGGISALLGLGLGRRLLLAAACTVTQLLLIGLVLEWIFRLNRWYAVVGIVLAMTIFAVPPLLADELSAASAAVWAAPHGHGRPRPGSASSPRS